MPALPHIDYFFPATASLRRLPVGPNFFLLQVKNRSETGTVAVDIDAQPALTSGSPVTWRHVGDSSFNPLLAADTDSTSPVVTVVRGDAMLRITTHPDSDVPHPIYNIVVI
jgi:hypothetical protein